MRALAKCLILISFLVHSRSWADESEPQLLQLYEFKPIYLIMGNPYTKIQLSFKTPIISTVPIYFGYTQLMFWDLFIPSPYFQDIDYNPLVFYRFNLKDKSQWFDFTPFEHESNGVGGQNERSWNRVALSYHFGERLGENARFFTNLKAWVPISYNANNEDLAQYRGLWEITLTAENIFGRFFGFDDISLRFYPGGESLTNPLHGGQELTLRTRARERKFLPLFVGQIFHGYGESLIDYQDERWGFRAGLGF